MMEEEIRRDRVLQTGINITNSTIININNNSNQSSTQINTSEITQILNITSN